MKAGLDEVRAWCSATNGRGPWWNSGASHMNQAYRKSDFDQLGLVVNPGNSDATPESIMNRRIRNRLYGGVGGRQG